MALIPERELVERHGWKLMFTTTRPLPFDTLEEVEYTVDVRFVVGRRYLFFPKNSDYPFAQLWPARSDRPAWYVAALVMQDRKGFKELRLNGRRSAVGESAANDSLVYLGVTKANCVCYFKDEGVVFESHPWVRSGPAMWEFSGPKGVESDIGVPTPVEFISLTPYATVYNLSERKWIAPANTYEEELSDNPRPRKIIL